MDPHGAVSDTAVSDDETAYAGLASAIDDARWAFGTGFIDPLRGLDISVPDGIDSQALATYSLGLADDALVLSQRLQSWITRLPELEEETAVANVALDLLGQARMLLSRSASAAGRGEDDDDLAFRRDPQAFRPVALVIPADEDFADLVLRLFVFSAWRLELLGQLRTSQDPALAAIAGKGVTEVRYHAEYAGRWVIRLGDGTAESHARMVAALGRIWPFVAELFLSRPGQVRLPGVAVDPGSIEATTRQRIAAVLDEATLADPRDGDLVSRPNPEVTTTALHELITEMQQVARSLPGAVW